MAVEVVSMLLFLIIVLCFLSPGESSSPVFKESSNKWEISISSVSKWLMSILP